MRTKQEISDKKRELEIALVYQEHYASKLFTISKKVKLQRAFTIAVLKNDIKTLEWALGANG